MEQSKQFWFSTEKIWEKTRLKQQKRRIGSALAFISWHKFRYFDEWIWFTLQQNAFYAFRVVMENHIKCKLYSTKDYKVTFIVSFYFVLQGMNW